MFLSFETVRTISETYGNAQHLMYPLEMGFRDRSNERINVKNILIYMKRTY